MRAQIMLKADVDGPGWTDIKISEAFGCTRKTVENVRERLVTQGFEIALNGKPRLEPPPESDGEFAAAMEDVLEVYAQPYDARKACYLYG